MQGFYATIVNLYIWKVNFRTGIRWTFISKAIVFNNIFSSLPKVQATKFDTSVVYEETKLYAKVGASLNHFWANKSCRRLRRSKYIIFSSCTTVQRIYKNLWILVQVQAVQPKQTRFLFNRKTSWSCREQLDTLYINTSPKVLTSTSTHPKWCIMVGVHIVCFNDAIRDSTSGPATTKVGGYSHYWALPLLSKGSCHPPSLQLQLRVHIPCSSEVESINFIF